MRTIITIIAMIIASAAFANGDFGSQGIGMNEARRVGVVKKGVVLESRRVIIKVEAGFASKAAGASIGAAVGGLVGGKSGNYAAAALMGTVGGILGSVAGEAVGSERKEGVEMIVLIEQTGELITVAQELQGTAVLPNGSNVFVANVNGVVRVFPNNANTAPAHQAGFRM